MQTGIIKIRQVIKIYGRSVAREHYYQNKAWSSILYLLL